MAVPSARNLLLRKRPVEWAVLLVMLVAGAALGHRLSQSTYWAGVRYRIYQSTLSFGQPARYPQRTAAVLLDDADYWSDDSGDPKKLPGMVGRTPTRRDYLAMLVTRLDEANVGVIAIDFDLRSPNPQISSKDFGVYQPETDKLMASIRAACAHQRQIVLAASITRPASLTVAGYKLLPSIYDSEGLSPACVKTGYIQLPYDMRRIPGVLTLADSTPVDSFALAAVRATNQTSYDRVASGKRTAFPFSRFISEDAFKDQSAAKVVFTGREILTSTKEQLTRQLVNRVVLIGGDWHVFANSIGPYVDRHDSPGGEEAGTLLHANYIEAVLAPDATFGPLPEAVSLSIDVLVVLVLTVIGLLEIHAAWKWGCLVVAFLFVITISYLFLQNFGLFLDFFFPLIILLIHNLFEHFYEAKRHSHRDATQVVTEEARQ